MESEDILMNGKTPEYKLQLSSWLAYDVEDLNFIIRKFSP